MGFFLIEVISIMKKKEKGQWILSIMFFKFVGTLYLNLVKKSG